MESRIKLIYGDLHISNIEAFLIIENKPMISIFGTGPTLAVYGYILGSKPTEIINIKLNDLAPTFSKRKEIIEYVIDGKTDPNLEKQKEVIKLCRIQIKFGEKIKKKVSELDQKIHTSDKIEIRCPSEYSMAVKNYARRKYSLISEEKLDKLVFYKEDRKSN